MNAETHDPACGGCVHVTIHTATGTQEGRIAGEHDRDAARKGVRDLLGSPGGYIAILAALCTKGDECAEFIYPVHAITAIEIWETE